MMFVARYMQVGVLVSAGLFALFGNSTATAEAQRDVTFALYERLQHMEERVQTLNGQIEVLNHQLHSMQQKQLAQFKDLDARLVKLAQTSSRSAPMTQALGQSPSSGNASNASNAGNLAATSAAAIAANAATAPINTNAYTNANAHTNANSSAYAKANAFVNANPYNTATSNAYTNTNTNANNAVAKPPAFGVTQTPAMTGTMETELTAQLAASGQPSTLSPAAATAAGSRASLPSSAPMTMATLAPSYPTPAYPARALSDKEEYQLAYAYIREKRYTQAQTALSQFLKSHAKSPYAANAHYWLGELNLLSGDIHGALQQFESIVSHYPQNNKMPDALLKLGYIYDDMGQFAKARTYLERLPAEYAGSTAAQLAVVRLQQMRQSTY